MQTNKLQSLDTSDLKNIDGGIIPIVVFGITISAKCVTGLFCTGAAIGTLAAAVN